jgi:predicted GNAT superfamily acetyltransferase
MLVITAMAVMGVGFAGGFWTQTETPSGDCHSHMPGARPESQFPYVRFRCRTKQRHIVRS